MVLQELPRDTELEFPHIMQVHASAGSGKTYILSLRFLQFLLSDVIQKNSINQILAITFTNAATEEMKRRIVKFLKSIHLGSDEKLIKELKKITTTEDLKDKAGHLVDQIIQNYDEFRIKTIDSFVNLIIRASTYELGLPPDYEIVSNYNEIIDLAFSNLIARVAEDERIRQLFYDFIDKFLKESFKPWDEARKLIHEFFQFETTYSRKIETLSSDSPTKTVREIENLIRKILEDEPKPPEKVLEKFKSILELTSNPRKILQIFHKGNILDKIGNPWLRESMREKLEKLALSTMTHEIKRVFDLYEETRKEVEKIKKKNRLILLSELNLRINKFLQEANPTWIYFKLGETIWHYLIDEFQDTSELQWSNIEPLIENALANGGSLFYVGDLKQLLYRYRGSSFKTFSLPAEHFSGFKLYLLTLQKNWRSRKNIVNLNNTVFSIQNLEKLTLPDPSKTRSNPLLDNESYEKVKEIYRHSNQEANREDGGYVKVKIGTESSEREEFLKWLDEILPDLIKRFGYSKIAILLRTNNHVRAVSKHLLSNGMPVISKANLDVRNHYVVRAIINFLEFLDFPPDNLSFAKFITSRPFETLVRKEFESWLLKKRNKKEIPLYREFREDFPDLWKTYLDELFKSVGYLPPYELIWRIVGKLRFFDNFPDSEAFIQKFLEVIYDLEENGALSLKDILDRIFNATSELFSLDVPEQGDAIVVSTVHSAKGLEFEVVITWPVLHNSQKSKKNIKFFNAGEESFAFKAEKIYTNFNRLLDKIYKDYVALESIDELNSLYVAATRAKSELYIYFPKRIEFKRLFEEFQEYGTPVMSIKTNEEKKVLPQVWSGYQLKNWFDHLANTITKPFELKEPIKRGDLIHKILSKIGNLKFKPGELHFPTYIKEIIKSSSEELGLKDINEEKLFESFYRFFEEPDIQKFFTEGVALTEKEIFSETGDHLRIDRVLVKDNVVEVIEFKTGEPELSKHRHQVAKYMRSIKKIYSDKVVKGYIIYFDTLTVIEV